MSQLFRRFLWSFHYFFVLLQRVRRKDLRTMLNSCPNYHLESGNKEQIQSHWSMRHRVQASTYVIEGCGRPGQEYGGVCASLL